MSGGYCIPEAKIEDVSLKLKRILTRLGVGEEKKKKSPVYSPGSNKCRYQILSGRSNIITLETA